MAQNQLKPANSSSVIKIKDFVMEQESMEKSRVVIVP